MKYILIFTFIFALVYFISELLHEIPINCNQMEIRELYNKLDKHHWYFTGYLDLDQINIMEIKIAKLRCNPVIKQFRTEKINQRMFFVSVMGLRY